MTGATFHRHLFLGVVKYSKLCESMTNPSTRSCEGDSD